MPRPASPPPKARPSLSSASLRPGATGSCAPPFCKMSDLTDAIDERRTFAIISHPDAGKTTLTEKLLLFGGAIQMAGAVRPPGSQRRARADWMAIEREPGISVTPSVMSFEHDGLSFNLLDTPGHEDFSE